MRRGIVLGPLMVVGTLSIVAAGYQAQAPAAPSPQALEATRIEQVRDNLYVITGWNPGNREAFSGGATGVFVTDSGVVIVDTKLAGWGQVILDRIRTVTDKPVTTIINTHTHGDHTGSNSMFGATVEIVAHENTRANMEKMDAFKGEGARFLPKRTYKDTLTLGSGKDRIDLHWFGRAHTNGDTWVVYPALRVMQTGDIFAWKDAPFIDANNGGSGVEYAATIEKALATVKNIDTLVVGHQPVSTPAELREHQQFMNDLVAASRAAMQAGQTADQAAESIDLSAKYQGYRKERYKAAIQVIYDELKK